MLGKSCPPTVRVRGGLSRCGPGLASLTRVPAGAQVSWWESNSLILKKHPAQVSRHPPSQPPSTRATSGGPGCMVSSRQRDLGAARLLCSQDTECSG